jgi:hypothetical protein
LLAGVTEVGVATGVKLGVTTCVGDAATAVLVVAGVDDCASKPKSKKIMRLSL